MSAKRFSRKEFLKGVAVTGAVASTATVMAGCKPTGYSPLPDKWDKEADVVIIGAGGTGIVAAIEAREAGASVIVLEKSPVVGGTTSVSGAVIQASSTPFQRDAGVTDDSTEAHYQYWMKASEGIANPELVRILAENAPGNMQWLVDHGVNFVSVYGVDPIPYVDPGLMKPRIHVPAGRGEAAEVGTGQVYIEILHKVAVEKGAEFIMETPATSLVRDPEKGIVGVKAAIRGRETFVKAKKGVILATSSFDNNKEMARAFSPQQLWALESGVSWVVPQSVGDGIKMAMEVGADLSTMGGTIGVPSTAVGAAPLSALLPMVPGIWVNKYGQRFVNEATHYAYACRAVFEQEQHLAWAIFDEEVKGMGGQVVGGIFAAWSDDLSKELDDGTVVRGDTLPALASAIGVNASQLEATVAKWNQDTTAGADTLFNKAVGLQPLATPPYYATRITEVNLGSIGGVKINTRGQVIDVRGEPIPRLYAGGMVAGGFIGPYYPGSGTAVAVTLCYGRITAENAVKEEAWS